MEPVLTFEQWEVIDNLYWSLYTTPITQTEFVFDKLFHELHRMKLASQECREWKELADTARYWISTHYIPDLLPRPDAHRLWNHWETIHGDKLQIYMGKNWPLFDTPQSGYIYVLKMGGWYKIGCTRDILKRFPQISVKMPLPTYLWMIFFVDDMYGEETRLHSYYASLRTNGEWFKIPDKEVQTFYLGQPYTTPALYARTYQESRYH